MAATPSDLESTLVQGRKVIINFSRPDVFPPVFIAGTFTDPSWEPIEMQHSTVDESGTFHYSMVFDNVMLGRYLYKLRIGNHWCIDETVATDFDGQFENNVIVLEPRRRPRRLPTRASQRVLAQTAVATSALSSVHYDGDTDPFCAIRSVEEGKVSPSTHRVQEALQSRINSPKSKGRTRSRPPRFVSWDHHIIDCDETDLDLQQKPLLPVRASVPALPAGPASKSHGSLSSENHVTTSTDEMAMARMFARDTGSFSSSTDIDSHDFHPIWPSSRATDCPAPSTAEIHTVPMTPSLVNDEDAYMGFVEKAGVSFEKILADEVETARSRKEAATVNAAPGPRDVAESGPGLNIRTEVAPKAVGAARSQQVIAADRGPAVAQHHKRSRPSGSRDGRTALRWRYHVMWSAFGLVTAMALAWLVTTRALV